MARTTGIGKYYIGIDNGVSGSIGIVNHNATHVEFHHTPTRSCLNYTKEVRNVTRVDAEELKFLLSGFPNALVILERPMVNSTRFQATCSAMRALEATLITLEELNLPYIYADSRAWQQKMLPNGIKGSDLLKKASLDTACRLFPSIRERFKLDGDGILIAEWARRERL